MPFPGAIFTDRLLTVMEPWVQKDTTGTLTAYLTALGGMFDLVAGIVTDQGFQQDPPVVMWTSDTTYLQGSSVLGSDLNVYISLVGFNQGFNPVTDGGVHWQISPNQDFYVPGWSVLLDPTSCPTEFLPWNGQFVGVPIQPGTDGPTAEAQILAESGFWRGTLASIEWAVQQNLSGSKTFSIQERMSAGGTPDAYHFNIIVAPNEVVDINVLTQMVNQRKPAGLQWTLITRSGYAWNQAVNQWHSDTMTWSQTITQQP